MLAIKPEETPRFGLAKPTVAWFPMVSAALASVRGSGFPDDLTMRKALKTAAQRLCLPLPTKVYCFLVIGMVATSLAAVATANWLINPFGQYSPNWLAPIVQDSRTEKVDLFERLAEPPQGLVLGSSRSMKLEPGYLQERTSIPFFNFAVNHGRPEDFLAIVRMYRDRFGCSPMTVIIGVDIASLNDIIPNDARLSSEPRLHAFADDTSSWSDQFEQWTQLFSYQQLSASLQSIGRTLRPSQKTDPVQTFDADGLIQYRERQTQMAAGVYDFESALQFNEREFLSVFSRFATVSKRRLSYLYETVRLCQANGGQVYLFATVQHPRLREVLVSKTRCLEVEEEAIAELAEIAKDLGANFIDFGTVDTFAGDPANFIDGIHPMESNTRLMIDRLLPRFKESSYALQ